MSQNHASQSQDQPIPLRRYSNRRYYDANRSQHVTLEEIYQMVRDGYDIEVTDSTTQDDITAKVLTQIILEHDTPKIDVFPTELLHQLIRNNEPLVREFVEKYFNRAFRAFLASQEEVGEYVRDAMGLASSSTPWSPSAWEAWSEAITGKNKTGSQVGPGDGRVSGDSDLRKAVASLQAQLRDLQQEVKDRPSA